VENAAKIAVQQNRRVAFSRGLTFARVRGALCVTLPSKREMYYLRARIGAGKFEGCSAILFWGMGQSHHWQENETYGGKLTENIVQAVARDLLMSGIQNLEAVGFRVVMSVHDEVVVDAPRGTKVETVVDLLTRLPAWAQGLPLRAAGYEGDYYFKD
jgi:DNA polymerase